MIYVSTIIQIFTAGNGDESLCDNMPYNTMNSVYADTLMFTVKQFLQYAGVLDVIGSREPRCSP